jgi:hypothetical protein
MGREGAAAQQMREAIFELYDGLTREQREQACLPFEDHAARTNWAYFPRREPGVALAELNHRQQKLVHRLLRAGLSFQAYARATTIMSVEHVLDEIEERRVTQVRDAGLYYLTFWVTRTEGVIFEPLRGWRFQGHHISVNYTFGEDGLAGVSPLFLGSNPARVSHNGYDILRPLGDAEDRARELLDALRPDQKARAIVHPEAPADMVLSNLPFVGPSGPAADLPIMRGRNREVFDALAFEPNRPLGIAAGELSPGQRDLLGRLVAVYHDRFPEGAAWEGMQDLRALHFAWAGSERPEEAHYYRLQGPHVVVEYDNTQNGANHVHTVCRHPSNDFGAEALGLHYATAHQ